MSKTTRKTEQTETERNNNFSPQLSLDNAWMFNCILVPKHIPNSHINYYSNASIGHSLRMTNERRNIAFSQMAKPEWNFYFTSPFIRNCEPSCAGHCASIVYWWLHQSIRWRRRRHHNKIVHWFAMDPLALTEENSLFNNIDLWLLMNIFVDLWSAHLIHL